MKKAILLLAVLGLAVSTTTAFAQGGDKERSGFRAKGHVKAELKTHKNWESHFVIHGVVKSKTADSITIESKHPRKNFWFAENNNNSDSIKEYVVKVNGETKYNKAGDAVFANILVGDNVVVSGKFESNVYTATHVHAIVKAQKVMGEVTAKTDTSVTVKNNVTGESKVVTVNPDTQVKINGEVKAATDIQVGDKGIVKFKAAVDGFVAKVINLFR